jgi:hypothetical protein
VSASTTSPWLHPPSAPANLAARPRHALLPQIAAPSTVASARGARHHCLVCLHRNPWPSPDRGAFHHRQRGGQHRRQRAAPSIIASAREPRHRRQHAASASPQIARPSPRMVVLPAFPAILTPHAPIRDACTDRVCCPRTLDLAHRTAPAPPHPHRTPMRAINFLPTSPLPLAPQRRRAPAARPPLQVSVSRCTAVPAPFHVATP